MHIQRVVHSFAILVEIDMTRVTFEGYLMKNNRMRPPMINEAWLFFYRFHDVIDPFSEWVVYRLFLFCSTFDFQMIETFIRIVDVNDLCTRSLIKSHKRSHVDRQGIGQRFLLELSENKQRLSFRQRVREKILRRVVRDARSSLGQP